MALDILKLILVSLIPVGCAVILMALLRYTKFGKIKKKYQTIIISTVFSITCILGTILSVKTESGAAINVRDASPIIAGLIFGGPAGIISGLVGGLYRFVAAFWDSSLKTTQIACSVATALAGFFTAFIRKYIFNNHHGKWYYGIFIAILIEDFHMLMAYITNLNNTQLAYQIVKTAFIPMLLTNALAVCAASIFVCLLTKEKLFEPIKKHKLKLTTKVQLSLIVLLVAAAGLVSVFGYTSVYDNACKSIDSNFDIAVSDLKNSVDYEVNQYMEDKVIKVANELNIYIKLADIDPVSYPIDNLKTRIKEIQNTEKLSEINIVKKDNYIIYSTQGYENFNMGDPNNEQAYEFTCLNEDTRVFVQEIREPSSQRIEQGRTKYAGCQLDSNTYKLGFVQIGLYQTPYHDLLDKEIVGCASYRHINQEGFLTVTDDKGNVVSISEGVFASDIRKVDLDKLSDKHYLITIDGVTHKYYTYEVQSEGYHIIAFADIDETLMTARISVMGIMLAIIFAFMMLYFVLYIIIKHLVTNRIEKIGDGLHKISGGDLNVKIDERNSFEMDALSDNINKTVESLKDYAIKEAEKNAEELRFAKTIQHSVLPTVFPLDEKFEIYASMDTAKEVGGDFYDFFYIDPTHVAIEVADVSGKGVPAALFMMQSKTIIKGLVESGMPVDEAFTEANKRLCESNEAQMFVTVWLGIVDLTTGEIEFVNAGHNPPIVSDENGGFKYLQSKAGFVLAGYDGYKYQVQRYKLKPGEKIYLYTDGVTEAMNKDRVLYGEETLLNKLNEYRKRGCHTICDAVIKDVRKHADGVDQSDDITMLCLGLNGNESTNVIVVDAQIENVERITNFVNNLLENRGADIKAQMQIDVAIDELFSNICYYAYQPDQHGQAKIVVNFYEENKVAIVFEDRGIPYNPLEKADPDAKASLEDRQIGGLGIYIVKKTMDEMTYKNVSGHNVVKLIKTYK